MIYGIYGTGEIDIHRLLVFRKKHIYSRGGGAGADPESHPPLFLVFHKEVHMKKHCEVCGTRTQRSKICSRCLERERALLAEERALMEAMWLMQPWASPKVKTRKHRPHDTDGMSVG